MASNVDGSYDHDSASTSPNRRANRWNGTSASSMPSGPMSGTPVTTIVSFVSPAGRAGRAVAIGESPKRPVDSSPGSPVGSASLIRPVAPS